MPSSTSRRDFLKGGLAAGAFTFTIAGTKASGRVLGANEAVRVGVAGLNGRGEAHVGAFSKMKDARITYLIDPDTRTFAKHQKTIVKNGGTAATCVQDVRQALEDKELDVLTIAAPNHWHALMTIWACQAGKDVYVEKPCSHNIHEGRIAVETARKHDRIVQHGTQSRSDPSWAEVAEHVKGGRYGKLRISRGLCYKPRGSIGVKPDSTAPTEVDYNLWLGPAPNHPFNANYVHYNWHWFWDFGNGDIGNQGVHQMDVARWMVPGNVGLPRSVIGLGGRFGYKDQGETPNTQVAVMDYGDTLLTFEVRGLNTDGYYGQKVGNILHLDEGVIADGKFFPKGDPEKGEPLPRIEASRGPGGGDHFRNFIEAVRSRKRDDLNAEILDGHLSAALCHLSNITYRLGSPASFGSSPSSECKDLAETFERMEQHLARDNSLKLTGQEYRLGKKLAIDAAGEKFIDCDEANALLTRNYRAPFVVPEKVG